MIIGYARVSTEDQDLGRQIKALQDAGCQEIYTDKISGSKDKRPQLDVLLAILNEGDVVVVQKLDRLGRSLSHLISLVNTFKEKKVGFRSLTDSFDTTTIQGNLIFQIIGAIAEFERGLIAQRTKDGLAYRKSQGVRLGRPPVDHSAQVSELQKLLSDGLSRDEIMRQMDITMYKFYELKKNLPDDAARIDSV